MLLIDNIVLINQTKNAVVVDQSQDQWFYIGPRDPQETEEAYCTRVILDFLLCRSQFFSCDVA